MSTRQYARLVRDWVSSIGLDPRGYGTHSLRRTKAALIYRKTGNLRNLRAVQLLLGHTKVDSTVRYLGVELEDALSISEKIDIRDLGERRGSFAFIEHGFLQTLLFNWTSLGPGASLLLSGH